MVRSRAKIEATIGNAQALLELDFIGDSGAYHFLHAIDQPVPPNDEWFGASPVRSVGAGRG